VKFYCNRCHCACVTWLILLIHTTTVTTSVKLCCVHARMERNNQFYYRAILQFCNGEALFVARRKKFNQFDSVTFIRAEMRRAAAAKKLFKLFEKRVIKIHTLKRERKRLRVRRNDINCILTREIQFNQMAVDCLFSLVRHVSC
jgi:hypothetical protein